MSVAQRWILGSIGGAALMTVAHTATGVDVTDQDRTFRNFTRETATVGDGQIRLELRGMKLQDEEHTRLNTFGTLQLTHAVDKVDGGIIDLLGSYGLGKNAEVGLDIPAYIESKDITNGQTFNNEDIGDILLYLKLKRSLATHCWGGAGFELTLPNGPEKKGFGTNELSFNPYISSRYQRGPFALGVNVGYQIYTGSERPIVNANNFQAKDVFNYGVEAIVRGSETYALRAEIAGRVWNQNGQRWHDAVLLPGIDVNLSDMLTIRPTGLANLTNTAIDWGIGIGVAVKFATAQPAAPQAPATEP